ncbi:MAG: PepSY domain-containing protein [Acaryochloridaceae cyanobacterium RU_4_10]|nr:PepSY domain-containing protein [Acaryochloridaceae cyanobacterium RU_4_10]
MTLNFRKLHRRIAPILFIPLLLSALTGIAYRLGRNWFNSPTSVSNFLMAIHQGEYLGQGLVPIYILLVGVGLLGLVATGLSMLKLKRQLSQRPSKLHHRWIHHVMAAIAFVPLTISATTGIAYRLGNAWFDLPSEQSALLLQIHQGSYLGPTLRPIYVLVVGLALIAQLVTGIQMSGILRRRPQ